MSQKFVMLFLVSKTQTVTLDAAAKVLIEEGRDSSSHSKYKSKSQQIYTQKLLQLQVYGGNFIPLSGKERVLLKET